GPELIERPGGLGDRRYCCGSHTGNLVGDAGCEAGIVTENRRRPAWTTSDSFGNLSDPTAQVAIAFRQHTRLAAAATNRRQGNLQHRRGLTLDGDGPGRIILPAAFHQS